MLMQELQSLNYTGYVMDYDPNRENINILDCAICASTNYEEANGTKNFNFQNANGYIPITNYGTITDYQAGQTNLNLVNTLDKLNVSYIYSLGAGVNEVVYYGKGLMNGSFRTEDIQANEAWLEKDLQISIINALDTLEKIKLQGTDVIELMNSLINPSFTKGQNNGAIAYNGTLAETDKLSIIQATGNKNAPSAVENNGYYFKIVNLTQEDINEKRVRIVVCYLAGGVVNSIRIINNIYGA